MGKISAQERVSRSYENARPYYTQGIFSNRTQIMWTLSEDPKHLVGENSGQKTQYCKH
jgi:hypothetical protein